MATYVKKSMSDEERTPEDILIDRETERAFLATVAEMIENLKREADLEG